MNHSRRGRPETSGPVAHACDALGLDSALRWSGRQRLSLWNVDPRRMSAHNQGDPKNNLQVFGNRRIRHYAANRKVKPVYRDTTYGPLIPFSLSMDIFSNPTRVPGLTSAVTTFNLSVNGLSIQSRRVNLCPDLPRSAHQSSLCTAGSWPAQPIAPAMAHRADSWDPSASATTLSKSARSRR